MWHEVGYFGNPNLMMAYVSRSHTLRTGEITYLYIVGVNDGDDGYLTFETPNMDIALEKYNAVVDGITVEELKELGFQW